MNPCGVILTYMDLRKWKKWWFNIPLLIGQLFFMIVGTAYGKIRWPKASISVKIVSILLMAICLWSLLSAILYGSWNRWLIPYWIFGFVFGMASFRGIPWRRVWRAAQVSHVRLVLRHKSWFLCFDGDPRTNFEGNFVADFGYPKMEIQLWRESWNDGKRFEYREPTFETSPEFIAAMIEYAEKLVKNPVARKYDWLQLVLGYVVNFTIWLFCPWLWGKEVVPWFNLPGGLEVCISGLVACLRWGEFARWIQRPVRNIRVISDYFTGYDTAVVWPCLVPLSKNWREK